MLTLEINENDIKRIKKRFASMPELLARKLQELVEFAVWGVTRESIAAVTSGPNRAFRTGNLARSMQNPEIGKLEGYAIARAPYAIFVHEGTRYMRERPFMAEGIKRFTPSLNNFLKSMLNNI